MAKLKKFIFIDGEMHINPDYQKEQNIKPMPVKPNAPLALLTSTDDALKAAECGIKLPQTTTESMNEMQSERFINQFKLPSTVELDGGELLEKVGSMFAKYDTPIGLLKKLLALENFNLKFHIDNSGSMCLPTDLLASTATDHLKKKLGKISPTQKLTRWEEAEDRLHIMIDILQYIPTGKITISFLNDDEKNSHTISLDHSGKTPEQFAAEAHQKIQQNFTSPSGGTPIYGKLKEAFENATGKTMHYLFTDGVPSDASIDKVSDLICNRKNPANNPLTFITCTDDDREAKWMKDVEAKAEWTSELDDYDSERKEVLEKQGPRFAYTIGMWFVCLLVAAINEHDLDALDEPTPLTKKTIDEVYGRRHTPEEYSLYFRDHPQSKKWFHLYDQFKREDIVAKDIKQASISNNNNPPPYNPATMWPPARPSAPPMSYQPSNNFSNRN